MSEMVERVARAIFAGSPGRDTWERSSARAKEWAIMEARAALAAMQEPTEAMERAAEAVECGAGAGYRAMIAAALRDAQSEAMGEGA